MYISGFLSKRIISKSLFVVLIFCTIITMIQILRILPYFSTKGNILDMFYIILLNIPKYISIALPISYFVATYNTFNETLSNFEIYAIRNTGLSNWNIFKPVLKMSIILSLILFIIFSFINPIFYYNYTQSKSKHLKTSNLSSLQEARFNKLSSQSQIFFEKKDGNQLKNVFVSGHEKNNINRTYTIIAENASIKHKQNGLFIIFRDGIEKINNEKNYQHLTFKRFHLNIDRNSSADTSRWAHNQYDSWEIISDLMKDNNRLDKNKSISNLIKRFIDSINIILFAFIAAYTVLSQNLQRNTTAKPLIISTTIVIGIIILSNLITPIGKKNYLYTLPIIIMYIFGFTILIKKFKKIDSTVKR